MRGKKPGWADFGVLRVIDGDDIAVRDATGREHRFRLSGYDAPENHNFRSKRDKWLEEKRGLQAMLALAELIRNARSFCLLPDYTDPIRRGQTVRWPAVALIDGKDVASIATREGWGVRLIKMPDGSLVGRKDTDWGDERTPFPDHLPLPEGFSAEWFESD